MFKHILPSMFNSRSSSKCSKSHEEKSSTSSSDINSRSSSEEISKSEVPTLTRRHSFVNFYPEYLFKEGTGSVDSSDRSIDPFDNQIPLKRSKSLSFEIPKRPSISNFTKRAPKSVHFDQKLGDSLKEKDDSTGSLSMQSLYSKEDVQSAVSPDKSNTSSYSESCSSNDNGTRSFASMQDYRNYENQMQKSYSSLLNDTQPSKQDSDNLMGSFATDSNNSFKSFRKSPEDCVFGEKESSSHFLDENLSLLEPEKNEDEMKKRDEVPIQLSQGQQVEKDSSDGEFEQIIEQILNNLTSIISFDKHIRFENELDVLNTILMLSEKAKSAFSHKESRIQTLLKNKEENSYKILKLESNKGSLEQAHHKFQQEGKEMAAKIETIKIQNELLQKSKSEVDRDNAHLANELMHQKTKVTKLEDQINSSMKTIQNSQLFDWDKCEELYLIVSQLLTRASLWRNESDYSHRELSQMKDRCNLLESALQTEREKINELNNEFLRELENCRDLENQLNNMRVNHLLLENSHTEIEKSRDDLITELESKSSLIGKMNNQISELETKMYVLEQERNCFKEKISEYVSQIEGMERKLQAETNHKGSLEETNNLLQNQVKVITENNDQIMKELKIELEQKKSLLEAGEVEKFNMRQNIKSIEKVNTTAEDEVYKLQNHVVKLLKKLEAFSYHNQQLKRYNNKVLETVEMLKGVSTREKEEALRREANMNTTKEYNTVLKHMFSKLATKSFDSLQPILLEESKTYFKKINRIQRNELTDLESEVKCFHEIIRFIERCISGLVKHYLDNEKFLEQELKNRESKYESVLAKINRAREMNFSSQDSKKENKGESTRTSDLKAKRPKAKTAKKGLTYRHPNI